jgi:hypothetical protein
MRPVPGGRRNSPPMRAGIPCLTPVRNCLSVSVTDSREWISILAVCTGIRAAASSRLRFIAEGDTMNLGESERLRLTNSTPIKSRNPKWESKVPASKYPWKGNLEERRTFRPLVFHSTLGRYPNEIGV